MKKLDNKGQSNLALSVATLAMVLFITTLILGKLFTSGTATLAGATAALAAFNNVTDYTWTSVSLVAIGLIVLAGMGLIGMIGFRRR